ncbi:hypothetical protein [Nonomuraea jiangxiensis]|uniref:Uncharacterized protein n=1 Tax=Nonomuraea jiangxiensis TaxID=633440 RepID=A0A1G8NUY8_9ACTN|nr:hypothetical protein [Nonomuraea jiangxiensis]SDI83320.1 hypothetical protein SAMN05421869_107220 [Nonomuraea jiangxiensis]
MVAIGFLLLGAGLVMGVLLALADPVLLSRVGGARAEDGRPEADVVRLPPRSGGDREFEAA